MSPYRFKRYNKTKVRHQRKELDERKKRISGLTLVQDMGQNSGEPERKKATKATTGFTRAVQEFGEQRRLFDTKAYASVVSKATSRPKITKGRLTVPAQGLFARGKISKPACRGPRKRNKAQDCELHEIIRQAQNNPRGQQYQLQKQHRRESRDCSPEVDDPDPAPSPDPFEHSYEGLSPNHDERFSPDYTSTKRQKEQHPFHGNAQLARPGAKPSTIVRDCSPMQTIADASTTSMSPSLKEMFSPSAKDLLSPDSQISDSSIREMELEENVMDGMTKWVTHLRATFNFSKLGYLEKSRQYLKDLHKETLRRELETAAVSQMAIATKPTMQTTKDVLQITLDQTPQNRLENGSLKAACQTTTNQPVIKYKNVALEESQMQGLSNQHARLQDHQSEIKDRKRIQKSPALHERRLTSHHEPATINVYNPLEGNPFSQRLDNNNAHHEPRKYDSQANVNAAGSPDSTDESFNFSPNVSSTKVITDFSTAFALAKPSHSENDNGHEVNRCRLREGRERVQYLQVEAAEERARLRQNKEREYREQFEAYKEKLRNNDRFRGYSCDRMGRRVDGSPGRSSKSLERTYRATLDQRPRNCNPGLLKLQNKEGLRKFGEENMNWHMRDKARREEYQRPRDDESRGSESANYRREGMKFEEKSYNLRSPRGLPDWLLEKTPERIFRPRKMYD